MALIRESSSAHECLQTSSFQVAGVQHTRTKKALCKLQTARLTAAKMKLWKQYLKRRGTNNLLTVGTGQRSGGGRGCSGGAAALRVGPRRSGRPFPGSGSEETGQPRPDPPQPSQPGHRTPSAAALTARPAKSRSEGLRPAPSARRRPSTARPAAPHLRAPRVLLSHSSSLERTWGTAPSSPRPRPAPSGAGTAPFRALLPASSTPTSPV